MAADIIKVQEMATCRRKTCPEEIITDNIIKWRSRTGHLFFLDQKLKVIFFYFQVLAADA